STDDDSSAISGSGKDSATGDWIDISSGSGEPSRTVGTGSEAESGTGSAGAEVSSALRRASSKTCVRSPAFLATATLFLGAMLIRLAAGGFVGAVWLPPAFGGEVSGLAG